MTLMCLLNGPLKNILGTKFIRSTRCLAGKKKARGNLPKIELCHFALNLNLSPHQRNMRFPAVLRRKRGSMQQRVQDNIAPDTTKTQELLHRTVKILDWFINA